MVHKRHFCHDPPPTQTPPSSLKDWLCHRNVYFKWMELKISSDGCKTRGLLQSFWTSSEFRSRMYLIPHMGQIRKQSFCFNWWVGQPTNFLLRLSGCWWWNTWHPGEIRQRRKKKARGDDWRTRNEKLRKNGSDKQTSCRKTAKNELCGSTNSSISKTF